MEVHLTATVGLTLQKQKTHEKNASDYGGFVKELWN